MAVLYTSTATTSLGGTAGSAGVVQLAFDRVLEMALFAAPAVSHLADKHPTNLTTPGSTQVLQFWTDLATDVAGATLTETVDPDSVSLATPTSVSIVLAEYGRSTQKTRALDLFSMANVDLGVANVIARDVINTIDSVAMTKLIAGTHVTYAGATATSTATITAAATITSGNVRNIVAQLETLNALFREGDLFWGGIHPKVAYDLRVESGALGWLLPNVYGADQSRIWNGTLGIYEGVRFVKNPRMYNATDGAASARNYRTLFAGAQALASSFAVEPGIVFGNQTDRLKRFRPVGWYAVGGYAIYRQDCIWRLESGASI